MDQAQVVARDALERTIEECSRSGLTDAWRMLVRDVYSRNLDRHEPNELGDTATAFGVQCAENLKTRAVRRFRHDDVEPAQMHWDIDGLRVTTPRNVLTFEFGNARVVTMKIPFSEGRGPNWDRSSAWEQDSQIRLDIASENSRVLQYRSHSVGVCPLFPYPGSPGDVRNFMLLWGGEADAPLTAGWLGIPILGQTPFIAWKMLWWDDESRAGITMEATPNRGPSFEERTAITPQVTLKPRYQAGQP